MKKIIYRNISEDRVDIIAVSKEYEETVGQVYQSSGMKWRIKTYFPVDAEYLEKIRDKYDGPIEAGHEMVKAWQYYVSLDPFKINSDEMFAGDFFK